MRLTLVVFVLIFSIVSCTQDKKARLDSLKKEQEKILAEIKSIEAELGTETKHKFVKQVSVVDVKKQDFNHFVDVQGRVDGEENVTVTAQTMGIVTHIYVTEGATVRQGQVLAELDAAVMKQGIEELKSTLVFLTDIYNKQKDLWDQKIGSEVQYLTAKNNKESLENKLKTIEEQLQMSKIKSPISGTVEDIPIKVGQSLVPGFPAFRVVNFSTVKIIADVAEAYTAKIKEGNNVKVLFPDFEKEIDAKVRFASKYINPINRTFLVEARPSEAGVEYRANMVAVLKINDYTSKDAFVLPINYVQSESKGKYLWVVKSENGKMLTQKLFVTTGQSYNGQIEILTGLQEGEKVVSSGFQELDEAMEVTI
ncbi:MAG: hypothetical protein A2275_18770 [Bacteroidetes bacterium RIFOXYA12_FULL_35_11]|nr:MAG: hypothetical protein A2X01_06585 [Bacteroidetes bacterium GWF2_35_48]OFY74323.1 MAG: hypothetical protein A2275_18770 [Bacteroidetes bacterium RIFOXYA12_FULL_35_11]OFY93601.1 MAG: hypothetical protein A2491_01010 [Bacteroidetes bacterium RIFOXYC12_FULL_35_7]OFY93990.1 MAG: hypothetical protein A2309_09640 [Bacteroidetes bacterium RIFOXYB2_FULL_35_7]HBX49680.1 efflux RND transporter periplasmic adaptor subunit [Bacteroidales bacterium]